MSRWAPPSPASPLVQSAAPDGFAGAGHRNRLRLLSDNSSHWQARSTHRAEWLDYQAAQNGRTKGSNRNKAQCMFYRKGIGDKHNIHRDHGFNDDKWTVCFSPKTDEGKHTGSWDSQRVKPRRSRLAVEQEVTRVPSDGQWICFTPWSNAVNTHLWGFGKVPRAPHAAPHASAGSPTLARIQVCRRHRRARRLPTRAPAGLLHWSRPAPCVRGVARYRAHEVSGADIES